MDHARLTLAIVAGLLVVGTLAPAAHGSGIGSKAPVVMRVPEPPAEAVRLHAKYYGAVQPSVRFWIQLEGRKLKDASPDAVSEASVAAAVRARFAGQPMAPGDVERLVVLVLMEINKQSEADLRTLAEKQKTALEAKKKLRELQALLDKQVADAAGKPDATPCLPPACGRLGLAETGATLRQTSAGSRIALPAAEPATLGELRSIKDAMKDKLDSLSELGEAESLRLQLAMDRLNKLMATLSNIMKKISDTAQSITQNLK